MDHGEQRAVWVRRVGALALVVGLGLNMTPVARAELLFDKPPATSADEDAVKADAAGAPVTDDESAGDPDDDVLFSKAAAPVIPHRSKDLLCAPLKNPRGWDRALGWRTPDRPLPAWGWERSRWCGDLDRVLDHLSVPVGHLARWASCEGAQANGHPPSSTMAPLCATAYDPKDWVEMRPRMTIYSVGTWTFQGQQCPAALVELDQLSGPLGGSTTHVLVPLEGSCPAWHGFDPMEKPWSPASFTPALMGESLQRWAGYDGEVPDGWSVAFTPVGQAASPIVAGAVWPVVPAPTTPPVTVQGLQLPPPVSPVPAPLPSPAVTTSR